MQGDRFKLLFEENFSDFGELGASCCVWRQGEKVLSLGQGFADAQRTRIWRQETPVLIWSATKALTSACLIHLCDQQKIHFDRLVSDFWPEYGSAGKASTTLRHVLSHQGGQVALRDPRLTIFDHPAVADQLARQTPFWQPGTGHGYHARTYGYLVDELVRRIGGGETLGSYFHRVFAVPLEIDLWIGLPPERTAEVADICAPKRAAKSAEEAAFYQELNRNGSLAQAAFATPTGPVAPSRMNEFKVRTHELPSLGGIGTAEALARFYHDVLLQPGFLKAETLMEIEKTQTSGTDLVLNLPTAFGLGYMKDPSDAAGTKVRTLFGPSQRAFGQPGAGGSHALVDPDEQFVFAYVMNQMEPGVFPNQKSLRLVEEIYAENCQ